MSRLRDLRSSSRPKGFSSLSQSFSASDSRLPLPPPAVRHKSWQGPALPRQSGDEGPCFTVILIKGRGSSRHRNPARADEQPDIRRHRKRDHFPPIKPAASDGAERLALARPPPIIQNPSCGPRAPSSATTDQTKPENSQGRNTRGALH